MVGEQRRSPAAQRLERLEGHAAARFDGLSRDIVDAVDPDVGVPVGRHVVGRRRSDRGHVATAELAHEVLLHRV